MGPPCYLFCTMRWLLLPAFFLTAVAAVSGQTATGTTQSLPDDPQKLLAAAEPFYDFHSPELKPWHLKATYQLYDDEGKPTEQGIYEYWWASPQVYRSTWTRKGATYSDWHTADGRHVVLSKGMSLGYFEEGLRSDFVSPLPFQSPSKYKYQTAEAQPKTTYQSTVIQAGSLKLPCVVVGHEIPGHKVDQPKLSLSRAPLFYCFDPTFHALLVRYSFGVVATAFDNVVRMQGKFLAREVRVAEGKRSILTAEVGAVDALSGADPVLVPDPDGALVHDPNPGAPIIPAKQVKSVAMRPAGGMQPGQQAEVLLQITVAEDGTVRDPRVILAPSGDLAEEARRAISQWGFKPFMQDGKPVEMKIMIDDVVSVR
jgi:TonB family protein